MADSTTKPNGEDDIYNFDDPSLLDDKSSEELVPKRKNWQQQYMDFIYQDNNKHPQLERLFTNLEKETGFERHQIGYVFLGLVALFILLGGRFAQILCNMVAFGGPAYASVKAIRSRTNKDDIKWLTYWCVFGYLSVLDIFPGQLFHFQIYWLIKSIVLFYLAVPENNAAEELFYRYIDPLVFYMELAMGNMPMALPDQIVEVSLSESD